MFLSEIRSRYWLNQFLIYFSWLSFISTVLVLTDAFSSLDLMRSYAFHWLDIVASYGFLIFLGVVEALILTVILTGLEYLGQKYFSKNINRFVFSLLLVLLSLAWTNLLLRLLELDTQTSFGPFLLVLVGVTCSWGVNRFYEVSIKWFMDTTRRVDIVVLVVVILSAILSAFLFLEPLLPLKPMPVTVKNLEAKKLPNIILIFVDALAARDMSLYGYPLPTTPNLEQETRTWLVFENAHSVSTNSVAEMPTTLTGRYPYFNEYYRYGDAIQNGTGWISLPQILQSLGYETSWYGYLTVGFYHFFSGFDRDVCNQQQLAFYLSRTRFAFRATFQNSMYPFIPYQLGMLGLRGLRAAIECDPFEDTKLYLREKAAKERTPFFIYMHYEGPNLYPFPAGPFLGKFLPVEEGLADEASQVALQHIVPYPSEKQPEVDKLRLRYNEAILNQDHQLAELIQTLKDTALYDDTMIIITADHGFNFENGYMRYSTPLVSANEHHVPLLVKLPHQFEGQRISRLVSNVDIFPTILDVLNISYPKEWIDGQSLLQSDPDKDKQRIIFVRVADYYHGPITNGYGILKGPMKLVYRNPADEPLLFDIKADPSEKTNRFNHAPYYEIQEELQNIQAHYLKRAEFLFQGGSILEAPQAEN